MSKSTLTIKQAAKYCDKSISTMRTWIRNGQLKATRTNDRLNSPLLIEKADLISAMQQKGLIEYDGNPAYNYQPDINNTTYAQSNKQSEIDRLISDIEYYREEIRELRKLIDKEREYSSKLQRELYSIKNQPDGYNLKPHGRGIKGILKGLLS